MIAGASHGKSFGPKENSYICGIWIYQFQKASKMSNDYLSQTETGALYNETSHKIGKFLKDNGYRNSDGSPSETSSHIVEKRASTNPGTWFYVWKKDVILPELDKAGFVKVALSETADSAECDSTKGDSDEGEI